MSVFSYLRLANPPIVLLLVFTAVTAGIGGGGLSQPYNLLTITLAVALCSMGARSMTNFVDRDIDAKMDRTKDRPLPSGQVSPQGALFFGLGLATVGLASAYPVGAFYVLLLIVGLVDNIVIYNLLTKRTTPWNIVLGAPSGGIPALVAYASMRGGIDTIALLLAALVVLWTPIHIWSLAIRYREDYAKADVPMLPVKLGIRPGIRCIAATAVLLALFTIALPFLPGSPFGPLTLVFAAAMGAALLAFSSYLFWRPTPVNSWRLFKFTSPYLAIIFTVMAANALLGRMFWF